MTGGLDCFTVALGDTWALLAAEDADKEAELDVAVATSPKRSSSGPGPGLDVVKLGIIFSVFSSGSSILTLVLDYSYTRSTHAV